VNAEVGTRNAEQKGKSLVVRDLKERTKAFALSILRLVDDLARSRASDVIGRQLLRAATSVAELRDEAGQLVAITIASIRTAREGGRPVPRSAFRVPR
jgi:hypothetical protein